MKILKMFVTDWWGENNETNFYNNLIIKRLQKKYKVVYSNTPDYLLYGPFGDNHKKFNNCVKIFFTLENKVSNFDECDYGIDFDNNIANNERHLKHYHYLSESFYDSILEKRLEKLKFKNKFCSFLVSARAKNSPRDEFFNFLNAYKKVDSGGGYLNNLGYRIGDRYKNFKKSKLEWLKEYKFNICFENSSSSGYLTEKLFHAFEAGCIPIYWGDPSIKEIINPNSYINVQNYVDFNETLEKIKEIDSNEEAYLNMLKQPIFLKDIDYHKMYYEKLDEFLDNIFSLNKYKAIKRQIKFFDKIKIMIGIQ